MNLERYEYSTARTYKRYFFYSEGPRGRIRKAVEFILFSPFGTPRYNLVLGDWNEVDKSINTNIITNNGDTEKVLATVAAIVVEFTAIFFNASVYVTGNSPARTRRYQIGINKLLHEIEKNFVIHGKMADQWEPFQKNVNYNAFLVTRIKRLILEEQTEPYMTPSKENKDKITRLYNDRVVDDYDIPDLSNDPAIIKKMEEARKALEECPFPEELLNRH